MEEITDLKLVINKHEYELVFENVNLKKFLKVYIGGIQQFSSSYIIKVGLLGCSPWGA